MLAFVFRSERRDSDASAGALLILGLAPFYSVGLVCMKRAARQESVRILKVIEDSAVAALKRRAKQTGEFEQDLFATSRYATVCHHLN